MTTTVLTVDGMSCEHCVNAVTKAVEALPGISGVAVDLSAGTVTVVHSDSAASVDEIKRAIEEQGYDIITN